jgi:hypothetical protein
MPQRITSYSWPAYTFPSEQAVQAFDQLAATFEAEFANAEDDQFAQRLIDWFENNVRRLGGVATSGAPSISRSQMPQQGNAGNVPQRGGMGSAVLEAQRQRLQLRTARGHLAAARQREAEGERKLKKEFEKLTGR